MMSDVDVAGRGSRTEGDSLGSEMPVIGSGADEVLESSNNEVETSGVAASITSEFSRNMDSSPNQLIEKINLFGPDVVLDCTRPHLRPEVVHHVETEAGTDVIGTSQDPSDNSAPDFSSGSCFISSIPEVVSPSAFADDPKKNEKKDAEAARVKFEPGVKCVNVSQAVEILKTGYRLSDVTIRKNMITWSSWNIADVIRGPHKETIWWKGRSLPRKKDAESDELQEVIQEELSGDKEFRQEMTELCRKIDTRDRELVQILDDILHVAQQNNYDSNNTEQTADPIEVLESQMTKDQPTANRGAQLVPCREPQMEDPGRDEHSADALNKPRNPFVRVMRAIRRRLSRRNRTRKHD